MGRFEARLAGLVRIATGAVFAAESYGKVTGEFVHGGFGRSASKMVGEAWPFWAACLKSIVIPHAAVFAWVVALGELAVGIGLLLGLLTRAAATGGALLVLAILLGQSYVPGSSWDKWVTAGLTSKFALLLLLLLAATPAAKTWALDAKIANRRRVWRSKPPRMTATRG